MQKQVLKTIQANQLLMPGQKVVVAVSGGPDSLCLLHILHSLAGRLGISLHVAHIHHRLRAEADAEAVAVKKWAIGLGLPVTVRRVDVKALQNRRRHSLQDGARRARYQALLSIARQYGASSIATAHHRDDLVETLLMRLLGGSGLDGLKGIPVKRQLAFGMNVIRPFHNVPREEIETYCRIHNLAPLLDPSNEQPVYLRNRIRLKLLPFLEAEFGPHVRRAIARTAGLLEADSRLLQGLAGKAYEETVHTGAGTLSWYIPAMQQLPEALQARVIRTALWAAGVNRPAVVHVRQVMALMASRLPSAQHPLPGGLRAYRQYNTLFLGATLSEKPAEEIKEVTLQLPGKTYLPWSKKWIHAEMIPARSLANPVGARDEAFLAADKLSLPLTARQRKAGDTMHPLGSPGARKVKKILADRKVPREDRDCLPLIISGGQIAWIGGVETAEPFRVTQDTEHVLHLQLHNN